MRKQDAYCGEEPEQFEAGVAAGFRLQRLAACDQLANFFG